jgi:hypothetical protein
MGKKTGSTAFSVGKSTLSGKSRIVLISDAAVCMEELEDERVFSE